MIRSLLLIVAAMLCHAQEMPVAGMFRDDQGALRVLQGIEGAWVAPILIPQGVDSAGSNGQWMWYKTGTELHLRNLQGGWAVVSAPEGAAEARFNPGGLLEGFVFPEAGLAACWLIEGKLGELRAWAKDPDAPLPPQPIGENLYLLRQGGSLLAWRAGSDPILIPLADAVSFQLFLRDGQNEVAVGSSFAMPSAAAGETSEVRFRLRNPTAVPILINRLSVDPGAFKIFDQFFPPRYIEPGGFLDFAVRFSPQAKGSYSSTLFVNDLKVTLNASAEAAPVVEIELPAGWQTLRAGDTTDLGTVERRATLRRALRVTPAVPPRIDGAGFEIQAGATVNESSIVLVSDKPGVAAATLDVGGRLFPLRATVTDFPTPRPAIVLPSEPRTAQQSRLTVRLTEPARAAYSAVLTLAFTPDAGLPDDSAVAFLPQAVRALPVRFAEGESESQEIVFQTGTTAGRITLKVALGPYSEERSIRVSPEPVALSSARAASSPAAAEVVFTGFDTTRSVSKVSFTFYLKNGQAASPGRIDADVATPFAGYFKSVTGGTFTLRANFPVSGTFSELDGVEVEFTNSAGTTRTGRLRFE